METIVKYGVVDKESNELESKYLFDEELDARIYADDLNIQNRYNYVTGEYDEENSTNTKYFAVKVTIGEI